MPWDVETVAHDSKDHEVVCTTPETTELMPHPSPKPITTHSTSFTPETFLEHWAAHPALTHPPSISFRGAVNKAFDLEENDGYIYHAILSVTLAQVQHTIDRVDADSTLLFPWYRKEDGQDVSSITIHPLFSSSSLLSISDTPFLRNSLPSPP